MTKRPVDASAYSRAYFTERCGGVEFFSKFGYRVLKPANQLAVVNARLAKNLRCLDLGCGRGELVAHLHEQGFDITGVDYSDEALNVARSIHPTARFVRAHAAEPAFPPASFDRIFCLGTIEHLTDDEVESLLRGAYELLRPGGRMVVTTCTNALYQKTLTFHLRNAAASGLRRLGLPVPAPRPPRSDEDERLHINEMSYFDLKRHFSRQPWHFRVNGVFNPKIYAADVYTPEILNDLPLRAASPFVRALYRATVRFPLSLLLARTHCVVADKPAA